MGSRRVSLKLDGAGPTRLGFTMEVIAIQLADNKRAESFSYESFPDKSFWNGGVVYLLARTDAESGEVPLR